MPDTPPWIQPADPAAQYLRGLQIGSSIGEAQSQLVQAEERMRMQNQAQREQLAQNALLAQTRLDYQQAYQNAQLKLDEKRLEDAAKQTANRLSEIERHNKAMEASRTAQWGPQSVAAQKWLVEQSRNQKIQENISKGMAPADAIKDAYLTVGGITPGIAEMMIKRPMTNDTQRRTVENRMDKIKKEIDEIASPELPANDPEKMMRWQELIGRLDRERQIMRDITPAASPVSAPPVAAATQAPAAPAPAHRNEVTRRTKSGKLAVFDADTKEFLRYAD